MNKFSKSKIVILISCSILIIVTLFLTIINTLEVEQKEFDIDSMNSNNNILYYNDTIYIDFKNIDSTFNYTNKLLNYSASINDLYSNAVDKLMQNDKNIKMYDKNDGKILETKLKKADAIKVFGNSLKIKDDVTVKVLFNDDLDNENIKDADFKINRENILRQKVVETAVAQDNNTGEKYWEWYGYGRRVEWCAVFVSWVAGQHGLIESGAFPKFVWVKVGVDFYKDRNRWGWPKKYTPRGGDVIFFDWNNNDVIDHVGIVEKVENGYVHTVEGNVKYKWVKRKKYKLNSPYIYGYGIPDY